MFLWQSYLKTAIQFIDTYNGLVPLAIELKKFFSANKRLGSRDRKNISELIYGFYRLGKYTGLEKELQCIVGSYLLGSDIYKNYYPNWQTSERLLFIKKEYKYFDETNCLKDLLELSNGVTKQEYINSIFTKPNTFIRLRKNKEKIIQTFKNNNIDFEEINGSTISIYKNINLEIILPNTSDYVIQDISSQQACDYFEPIKNQNWWDACAASGGKSLALLDKERNINLYISDIRESILLNLQKRFNLYGHTFKQKQILDLTINTSKVFENITTGFFDNIIVDAPCSGSGTWARSPEQHYFYKSSSELEFQKKQIAIVNNCTKFLKPNGKLYYITCSAFKAENEDVVDAVLKSNANIKLVQTILINNTNQRGDIMFLGEFVLNTD